MAWSGGMRNIGFMEDTRLLAIHEECAPKGTDCKHEQCFSREVGCLKQVGDYCRISLNSLEGVVG